MVGIIAHATDDDATNSQVVYSLKNDDGGNFSIDSFTGVVSTAAMLDREALGTGTHDNRTRHVHRWFIYRSRFLNRHPGRG